MRGRSYEEEVPIRISGECLYQFESLLLRFGVGIGSTRPRRDMGLIDDDKVWRVLKQHRLVAIRFQEIDASNKAGEVLVNRDIRPGKFAFEPAQV